MSIASGLEALSPSERSLLIQDMRLALKDGRRFSIVPSDQGKLKLKLEPLFWRVISPLRKDYHRERRGRIAELLSLMLEDHQDLEIQATLDDKVINLARKWEHKVAKRVSPKEVDERISRFRHRLLACKLGTSTDVLDLATNRGFAAFAARNALHRALVTFDHQLEISNEGSVQLRVADELVNWSEIRDKQLIPTDKRLKATEHYYNYRGYVPGKVKGWDRLTPFKIIEAIRHGSGHFMDLCYWVSDKPKLGGNHFFFHLINDRGEMCSIGEYRPDKHKSAIQRFRNYLTTKPSYLMQPDISDYWRGKCYTLRVEISREDYAAIVEQIEYDNKHNPPSYRLLDDNCGNSLQRYAAMAGIHIPIEMSLPELFWKGPIRKFGKTMERQLPGWLCKGAYRVIDFSMWSVKRVYLAIPGPLRKLCRVVAAIFLNLLSICAGGKRIAKEAQLGRKTPLRPYVNSLTNPRTLMTAQHPWIVRTVYGPQIQAWRNAGDADSRAYALPEQFRLPHSVRYTRKETS